MTDLCSAGPRRGAGQLHVMPWLACAGALARKILRPELAVSSILAFGANLLEAPFRALFRIARELGRKPDDRGFDGPVDQAQLLEPLESALQLAALPQPLDRVDRSVLMAHADEGCWIISALLGQPNAFVDEGIEFGTG